MGTGRNGGDGIGQPSDGRNGVGERTGLWVVMLLLLQLLLLLLLLLLIGISI